MKKRFLYFLLPALLVTSCGTNPAAVDVLKRSQAFVAGLEDTDMNHYTIETEGHVLQFTGFKPPRTNGYSLPTGALDDMGTSYILRAPIRITKDNFYPAEDSDDTYLSYAYGFIRDRLLWQYDNRTTLQMESDDETITFFVEGLSKNVIFYNVITMEDNPMTPDIPDDYYSSSVTLYARYDMAFTYNKEGLLVEERCVTQNPMSDALNETVDVTATYTYSIE